MAMGAFQGIVAVRQLGHPVEHAFGDRTAAAAADAVMFQGLQGIPADPALAVTIKMVFSLLGEEVDGSLELTRVSFPDSAGNGIEIHWRVQQKRVATEFIRRVGVGIGDQRVLVQVAADPVHGRIRGEAGFHRVDLIGKITVAVPDGVKPGTGPQRGKPGCPDVSRNEHGPPVRFQYDFQQIAAVHAQDGTTVGGDVGAPRGERPLERTRGLNAGKQDQVVYFADAVIPLVDGADLRGDQE